MSRLGGLRGRLLVAFVFTSVLTLAVVGAIVLGGAGGMGAIVEGVAGA